MPQRSLEDLEIDAFLARAETLAQLMQLPAWEAWTSLLSDMRQKILEDLARAGSDSDVRFLQGAASALGEILERPARIVARADEVQQAEAADKPGTSRPELRSVLGFGTDRDGDI